MTLRAYFYNRRNRNLAMLAAVAAAAVLLAFWALNHRAAMVSPRYAAATFLPGLARALDAGDVTHIRIVSKRAAFDVAFVPSKGWVLPASGNYPASFEIVKQTLVALAALETVEPKTDDPALYSYVGLEAPPKGDGVAITLGGDRGKVLASLILGKSEARGDDGIGLFVRKRGERQSWLVKSPSDIKTAAADWMDKAVLGVNPARVASISIEPSNGSGYTLAKTAANDAHFALAPLPKGREIAYAGAGDSAAGLLSDFAFDDIARSTDFDFTSGAKMTVQTFDGLSISVNIVPRGGAFWARVLATAAPGKPAAAKEAIAINARTVGWAFKLPPYKASLFAPPLETLLKPK